MTPGTPVETALFICYNLIFDQSEKRSTNFASSGIMVEASMGRRSFLMNPNGILLRSPGQAQRSPGGRGHNGPNPNGVAYVTALEYRRNSIPNESQRDLIPTYYTTPLGLGPLRRRGPRTALCLSWSSEWNPVGIHAEGAATLSCFHHNSGRGIYILPVGTRLWGAKKRQKT